MKESLHDVIATAYDMQYKILPNDNELDISTIWSKLSIEIIFFS